MTVTLTPCKMTCLGAWPTEWGRCVSILTVFHDGERVYRLRQTHPIQALIQRSGRLVPETHLEPSDLLLLGTVHDVSTKTFLSALDGSPLVL